MAKEVYEVHHYFHFSRELDRLLRELNRTQTAAISETEDKIMASLDEVLEAVAAESTKIDSLNELMDGVRQQLADALAGATITPEQQAKIDAVFANVQANVQKVQDAIDENTAPA